MRISTGIKIAGTKSFRLSCSKLLDIYGTNLQNPPPELLECLIPSYPDWSFVQVDQSGAESVIVAYEARPGRYRELIELGIKPHIYIAMHLFMDKFGLSREKYWKIAPKDLIALPEWKDLEKKIKNSGTYYDLGKRTNHARSYKMGWRTFQLGILADTGISLTPEEAKRLLATWDSLFPEVIEWQAKIEKQVHDKRILYNAFGFPRRFYGLYSDEMVREAISWIPQSTVGCITHFAYIAMTRYIEDNKLPWRMLNNKHDSYLLECPDKDIEHAKERMLEFMQIELPYGIRMKAEAKVGKTLKEAK